MAEEHGFQAPEGHQLCANNCGFFGNLTSSNLCSKCYRDLRMKEEQGAFAKAAFDANGTATKSPARLTSSCSIVREIGLPETGSAGVDLAAAALGTSAAKANRCLSCRRRVGLTGFKCRCGSMYCGSHRYAEQHSCTFDYKAAGKEAIAKANPVVKAEKLNRI